MALSIAHGFFNATNMQWVAAAKPATRPDGTALVTDDRYYDSVDCAWYSYNSTVNSGSWLSEQEFSVDAVFNVGATAEVCQHAADRTHDLYLSRCVALAYFSATHDADNYWAVQTVWSDYDLGAHASSNLTTTVAQSCAVGKYNSFTATLGTFVATNGSPKAGYISVQLVKVGTPSNWNGQATIFYKLVKQ